MKKIMHLSLACLLAITSLNIQAEQAPKKDNIPQGWSKTGKNLKDYVISIDQTTSYNGLQSLVIESTIKNTPDFGSVVQVSDATQYKGKRVQLTAYIKSENVTDWAGAWFRVDGDKKGSIAFDNMYNRKITGTNGWIKCTLVLDVPEHASKLVYGALLRGDGKIWLDELSLDIVDKSVPVTDMNKSQSNHLKPRNLSFEND